MSTQGAVKEILKNTGVASIRQIRAILGLTDDSGRDRVYRAIYSLQRTGWAKRVRDGVYEYTVPKNKTPRVQEKIWRAIRVSRQFTVSDLILLTDADRSYISSYVRFLKNKGFVRFTGRKKEMQPVYSTTDKATPQTPLYTKTKSAGKSESWQELEEKTWNLVRLVLKTDTKLKPQIKAAVKELCEIVGTICPEK